MSRYLAIILSLLAARVGDGAACAGNRDQGRPPNVVIFLADDLGWGDLGCFGNTTIKTPNLDRFALQGVRLTQCYAACGVCSPSRSAILTGRTPYRNGVWRWIPEGSEVHLRTSEITLAKLLKARGYATGHVGKWHLNGHFNSPLHPQPNDHGFDYWLATQNNASPSHKNPHNFVRNGRPAGLLNGFSGPLIVNEAIDWLRHRDANKPFYLNVWTHEPHLPIESDARFMEHYPANDVGLRQHHGNVTQLDDAFGKLMAALEDLGVAGETIVFFTSDNGPEGTGEPDRLHPGSQQDRNRGSTGGLRGRKRDCYEGGIRVPGIVRWPGHIQPETKSDVPVIGTDIFTTVCAIAGIAPPGDRVIDGADMRPAFDGKPVARVQPLYWRTHIASPTCRVALRIENWKIVANEELSGFELYDLAADPRETNDLAAREPAVFSRMKQALREMDAKVKAEGPDWWKREPAA
jgi:arylsulfatase A